MQRRLRSPRRGEVDIQSRWALSVAARRDALTSRLVHSAHSECELLPPKVVEDLKVIRSLNVLFGDASEMEAHIVVSIALVKENFCKPLLFHFVLYS